MRAAALVVAAGSGRRLGCAEPKAFVALGGRPLLFHTLRVVAAVRDLFEVVVVVPAGSEPSGRAVAVDAGLNLPVKIVAGGMERQDSVRIGLGFVSAEAELVAVHDAARPFATAEMFTRCLEAAAREGAASVGIPLVDSLKEVSPQGFVVRTLPRENLFQVQTPQAFRTELLRAAHQRSLVEKITATDDTELVEKFRLSRVVFVPGSRTNFKITTPEDLDTARAILSYRSAREVSDVV